MKIVRVVLAAAGLVAAAGLIAPHVKADSFRRRVEDALDRALGRKVKVGDVRFNLFTGPGFTIDSVTIPEDPSIGIEPFAYVESLDARIRLLSLLRGRMEFSNLRLEDTTVNLAKAASGAWNFQTLLNRAHRPEAESDLPAIQVRSGRLNFKFGDTKSVFYFDDADLDVVPQYGGRIAIRFTGEPSRTDRTGQSFGLLSGDGVWRKTANAESRIDMELDLERSPLVEVMRLFGDRGVGLHGNISSVAHLSGPVSDVKIAGQLQIEDIHRWDLMPARGGGWRLNYRGALRPVAQELSLETVGAAPGDQPPVGLRFRAANYLGEPRWAAAVEFHQLPAGTLLEVARHIGVAIPEQITLDGNVAGVIGYGQPEGWQGQVELEGAALQAPGAAPIRSSRAGLLIAANSIELKPSAIEMDRNQILEAQGRYALDSHTLDLRFSTKGLSVADLHSGPGRLLGAASVPVLDGCRQGVWAGWIGYHATPETGAWSGNFELRNARIDVPGAAEPLRLSSASVVIDGPRVNIARARGALGSITFDAAYRWVPDAIRPEKIRLSIPRLDLAEAEQLLMPVLRRQQGFLARTFRFGRPQPPPDWLKKRMVDASMQIADLQIGDDHWTPVKCRVLWDGPVVRLAAIDAQWDNVTATGEITADLTRASGPHYGLDGSVRNLSYGGGLLDLEGHGRTSGIGLDLAVNASGQGDFHAHDVRFSPVMDFHDASGCFDFAMAAGAPRIRLTAVQAEEGFDTYIGQGGT
ncbi:MAG: AsmA family protein, partial [Bryobacteraceae bacterium]